MTPWSGNGPGQAWASVSVSAEGGVLKADTESTVFQIYFPYSHHLTLVLLQQGGRAPRVCSGTRGVGKSLQGTVLLAI